MVEVVAAALSVGGVPHYAALRKDAAVQRHVTFSQITLVTADAPMSSEVYGGRAKCLQRLIRLAS